MDYVKVGEALVELGTTTVIIGAVIYLLVKYFAALIDKKIKSGGEKTAEKAAEKAVEKEKQKQETTLDHMELGSLQALKDMHPYFSKVDNLIKVKLPITKIGGPVRTLIFRDVLEIFYESGKKINLETLERDITNENFLTVNLEGLTKIIDTASYEMQRHGIPPVVIEKFWEWNYKRHEYVMNTISDIDSSSVFNTVLEKQYAVLNLYQSASYFVLLDAENTLKSLNGDLTGTTYKGQTVESLHEE